MRQIDDVRRSLAGPQHRKRTLGPVGAGHRERGPSDRQPRTATSRPAGAVIELSWSTDMGASGTLAEGPEEVERAIAADSKRHRSCSGRRSPHPRRPE